MKFSRLMLLSGSLIAFAQPAFAGDNKRQTSSSSLTVSSSDRLGNTRIQRLTSGRNQASKLGSSVQKKKDDVDKGVIGNIR